MKIDFDAVLKRADELYAEAKHHLKHAPQDTLPRIQSDQVKSVLRALVEALNNEEPPAP